MKKEMGLIVALVFSLTAHESAGAAEFSVSSAEVSESQTIGKEQIFNSFGCEGDNVSPSLHWANAPSGTKSYAVTVYDPDAPTGSGWWHWVVFNIPATVTRLPKNAGDPTKALAPSGSVQSRTDFGKPGYGGPCPPQKDKAHRYQFTVYALKVDKLPLGEDASGAMVGFYLHQNMIKKTVLSAKYGR